MVRTISNSDCEHIADLHVISFKNFFLTSLGKNFLKTYYSSLLVESSTIALCFVNTDDKIIGFATGTLNPIGYHKRIFFLNPFSFIRSIFISFLRNPILIVRLIKNINKKQIVNESVCYSELLSLAVHPEYKGAGVSKFLLDSFENITFENGKNSVSLTTDVQNNERAINFYKKCGYNVHYSFIAYPDREMFRLIKYLN